MKQPSIQTKRCPKCSRDMVALQLTIDEQPRTLRSCSHCDLRIWETQDGNTTLDSVLTQLAEAEGR